MLFQWKKGLVIDIMFRHNQQVVNLLIHDFCIKNEFISYLLKTLGFL